jgi:hypothetical protein
MPTMKRPHLRLPSADEEKRAASALGAGHPLVRSLERERVRAFQVSVTAIPVVLGIAGVLRHDLRAPVVLGAAALVELALFAAMFAVRGQAREHARELIAAGRERLPLHVVDRERRALASSRTRRQLARSLERHLRDADRWDTMFPRTRPLVDLRRLRFARREASEVVARLRSPSPSVRGIAAVFQLLTDSRSSPLFAGEVHELRTELMRVADLLESSVGDTAATADAQLAA